MAALIVVGGFPGTGKSVLSAQLSIDLTIPRLCSDTFGGVIRRVLADQIRGGDAFRAGYELHNGEPYDPRWTSECFERLAATCRDVQAIRFHDMRHTHATQLLEEGYSTKYVAERLGDREDTITRTYAHVTSKSRRRAVETISALLDEPASGENAIPSLSRRPKKRAR